MSAASNNRTGRLHCVLRSGSKQRTLVKLRQKNLTLREANAGLRADIASGSVTIAVMWSTCENGPTEAISLLHCQPDSDRRQQSLDGRRRAEFITAGVQFDHLRASMLAIQSESKRSMSSDRRAPGSPGCARVGVALLHDRHRRVEIDDQVAEAVPSAERVQART